MEREILAVERAERLKMIEHLEVVVQGLQDVNAGVPHPDAQDLRQWHVEVASTKSLQRWQYLEIVCLELLAKIAVELLMKAIK
jgi:hypothetical protein